MSDEEITAVFYAKAALLGVTIGPLKYDRLSSYLRLDAPPHLRFTGEAHGDDYALASNVKMGLNKLNGLAPR